MLSVSALADSFVAPPEAGAGPALGKALRAFAATVAGDPRGGLRIAGRVLWLMVPALILVPAHYLWKMLGRPSPWPLHFLRLAARACGLLVEIVGAPLQTQVFFVANHVSWIDIPALDSLTGTAFVAQNQIADWPVFG